MFMRSFMNRIPLLSIISLLVNPYSRAYQLTPSLRSNLPYARSLVRPLASKISNDVLSWDRHQEDILSRHKAIAYDDIESSERRRIKSLTDPIRNSSFLFWSLAKSSLKGASLAIRQSWWCFPMALALFPVYCLLIGTYAQMPSFWALKTFDHIRETARGTFFLIGFLLSNISYFYSGMYLLNLPQANKLPLKARKRNKYEDYEVESFLKKAKARDPILGKLVLLCGTVSVLYHAFQSLGSPIVAETLCFIDHGCALTSIFCFWKMCGLPSKTTMLFAIPSLVFLLFPGDKYLLIHSLWHFTSASTSVSWARDGVHKRKKFIAESLNSKRQGL